MSGVLDGKAVFVTGASRGIGRSIAVALAASGADVALVARTEAGLAGTAADITALGRKAVVIPTDVTRKDEVDAAVAAVPLAKQLDRAAIRRRFEHRFTSERMARDYLSIYDQVLSTRAFGTRTNRGLAQAAD